MQTTIGKPETLEALLQSEGIGKRGLPAPQGFTRHVYDHSEIVQWKHADGSTTQGWAHMFKCTVTGALRRWGIECVPFGAVN